MKLQKKIYIYIVLMIVLIVVNIGLYKGSTVVVGDIVLHKPTFYRFISIPSTKNNSRYELFKHYIGIKSNFKFEKGSFISLQFKHLFSSSYVSIILTYREVHSDLEMMVIKENMKNIIDEDKCMYQIIQDNDDLKEINGFYMDKNLSFNIIGNSQSIAMKLKDDICAQ